MLSFAFPFQFMKKSLSFLIYGHLNLFAVLLLKFGRVELLM